MWLAVVIVSIGKQGPTVITTTISKRLNPTMISKVPWGTVTHKGRRVDNQRATTKTCIIICGPRLAARKYTEIIVASGPIPFAVCTREAATTTAALPLGQSVVVDGKVLKVRQARVGEEVVGQDFRFLWDFLTTALGFELVLELDSAQRAAVVASAGALWIRFLSADIVTSSDSPASVGSPEPQ